MAKAQNILPGRLVVSIIYSSFDALVDSLKVLERKFGRIECETTELPCSSWEMYREEMGDNLQRRLFSFERPYARDSLVDVKKICHKIEPQFADNVRDYIFRTVNIDPGILSHDNLVMTSHRGYNHRIYLRDGVFAQIELIWSQNCFMRLPWTNPDFCEDEAIDFFERVRSGFEVPEESQRVAF